MAGRISEDFINEVRDSVNIVDVISQYVSLEKRGKDYVGLCPFHQEKTPSFSVNPEKQFFYCFGCHRGGNVYKFIMEKEEVTFPESVERVAEFANIPMPQEYQEQPVKLNPLMQMHQDAADFYQQILLTTKIGERGLNYARQRELDDELLKHFKIGYAPDRRDLLLTYLKEQGYTDEQLAESGLFVQTQDGRLFDRFRDRLMFPMSDETGHPVAFSGRRISDNPDEPKYINSPETSIFNKSDLLFHFSEAKKHARKEGHLVLFEGHMDVISAYKSGIKTGIASMGTSLTQQQVYMIRRITRQVVINYDGDDPGIHAAERAVGLFKQAGSFDLGIVILPDKLDPDEYVKQYGAESYQAAITGAISTTDFFLLRLKKKYNLNNEREQVAYLSEAVQEIATLQNPVEQDLYVGRLAKETGVSLDALKMNLSRARRRQRRIDEHTSAAEPAVLPPAPVQEQQPVTRATRAQQRLLYAYIYSDEAREYLLLNGFVFPSPQYERLAKLWLNYIETHENVSLSGFLDFIPEELQSIIVSTDMMEIPGEITLEELEAQVRVLNLCKIDDEIGQHMQAIADARRRNDQTAILRETQAILQLRQLKLQEEEAVSDRKKASHEQ
ncbi:DNA primase [Lactobacillus nasalidis]|uniref:DNA primase n=3 Tax=Lactobacillus nasalidis TaxID=2797258 RepID=UPI001915D865|nr:DNA primase [Lactobacillus nasalidis]